MGYNCFVMSALKSCNSSYGLYTLNRKYYGVVASHKLGRADCHYFQQS